MNPQIKIEHTIKDNDEECYRVIDKMNETDVGFFQAFGKGYSREWTFVPMLNALLRISEIDLIKDVLIELNDCNEIEDKSYKLVFGKWQC